MPRPLLVSPSYRRAGEVDVRKLFPKITLAVHEHEADEYREKNGEPIMELSEESRGNMAAVRNEILERGYEKTRWIVTMDDDVGSMGFFQWEGREKDRATKNWSISHAFCEEKRLTEFITNGFIMAEEVGAFLWGVNLAHDPKWYREYSPLSMLAPILGPFSCHIENPLRYDRRLGLNEDYDFWLQHVHRYHRTLRFNKWFYIARHLDQSGGVAAYRQMDEERRQADIMLKKWGPDIVSYNFEKSTNPRVRVPLKGI